MHCSISKHQRQTACLELGKANSYCLWLISTVSIPFSLTCCFLFPFFQVIVLSSVLLTPHSAVELLFASDRLQPDARIWRGRLWRRWVPCLETSNPCSVTLLKSPPKTDVSTAAITAAGETAGYLAAREHLQLMGSSSEWSICPTTNLPSLTRALRSAESLPASLSTVRVIVCNHSRAQEQLRTRWCTICTPQAVPLFWWFCWACW